MLRGEGGGSRGNLGSPVRDTTVFSRVLYRLSYLAESGSVYPGCSVG